MEESRRQPTLGGVVGNQRGFTLIELIVVIVVLGLLAAVAVPKYQDIQAEAKKGAANGVFGAANGATAVNFAANLLGKNVGLITNGTTLAAALDGLPTGWFADATGICSNGTTTAPANCTAGTATYNITVATAEDADSKAVLAKSGF